MIRKIFKWIFKDEVRELETKLSQVRTALVGVSKQQEKLKNILGNIDVGVDIHEHSPSWAVISLQGERSDYIKFINLEDAQVREISQFLQKFDRQKIDARPDQVRYLREDQKFYKFKTK